MASVSVSPPTVQLAPLRSLDDFLLGSARFQLPAFNDLDKWGNRVVKNLLYYQTNYILMFSGIYLLMAFLNPTKVIFGLIIKIIILGIITYFFTEQKQTTHENPYHKWYFLIASIVAGYLLMSWYDAMFISAFTLFLSWLGTFFHASMRLRNMQNKIVNMKESLVPTKTPMGIFLNAMNISADSISR